MNKTRHHVFDNMRLLNDLSKLTVCDFIKFNAQRNRVEAAGRRETAMKLSLMYVIFTVVTADTLYNMTRNVETTKSEMIFVVEVPCLIVVSLQYLCNLKSLVRSLVRVIESIQMLKVSLERFDRRPIGVRKRNRWIVLLSWTFVLLSVLYSGCVVVHVRRPDLKAYTMHALFAYAASVSSYNYGASCLFLLWEQVQLLNAVIRRICADGNVRNRTETRQKQEIEFIMVAYANVMTIRGQLVRVIYIIGSPLILICVLQSPGFILNALQMIFFPKQMPDFVKNALTCLLCLTGVATTLAVTVAVRLFCEELQEIGRNVHKLARYSTPEVRAEIVTFSITLLQKQAPFNIYEMIEVTPNNFMCVFSGILTFANLYMTSGFK